MPDEPVVGDGGGRELADSDLQAVPLFPLPGVVFFPGAVLPLHIFEQRYRAMTSDALGEDEDSPTKDGRRLVCMCRVLPGADPMDDEPALFAVACVGQILDAARLPDGRYNFVIRGLTRVRLGPEYPLGDPSTLAHDDDPVPVPYRRSDLTRLASQPVFEIDLDEQRSRLAVLAGRPPIAGTRAAGQLERLFASPTPTVELADVLAYELLEDADAKQSLLEELDPRARVARLADLLDRQFPDPDGIPRGTGRFDDD